MYKINHITSNLIINSIFTIMWDIFGAHTISLFPEPVLLLFSAFLFRLKQIAVGADWLGAYKALLMYDFK